MTTLHPRLTSGNFEEEISVLTVSPLTKDILLKVVQKHVRWKSGTHASPEDNEIVLGEVFHLYLDSRGYILAYDERKSLICLKLASDN